MSSIGNETAMETNLKIFISRFSFFCFLLHDPITDTSVPHHPNSELLLGGLQHNGSNSGKSIYKFGLSVWVSVCLSVCLYPINVKTAEPIGPNFFVGHLGTPGKVYEKSKFQIFVSIKIRSSLNF